MQHYSFHPTVVVRTPLLPFEPEKLDEAGIRAMLHEDWFLEAIFLASPSLYRTAIAWRDGAKLEKRKEEKLWASLTKYYSRMMSRCTPFGLFASCTALKWGEAAPIALSVQDTKRHTRLDMHFLCALALSLAQNPNIRPYLSYFPNSSLYPIGNELRYVEYIYVEGRRSHQISAVDTTDYLERVIKTAQTGACYADLVEVLVNDEITASDAQLFIDQLIAAQLLVSELEPAITGVSFLQQILQVLKKVFAQTQSSEVGFIISQLDQINQSIDRLDSQRINSISDYEQLIELLKTLNVTIEENKLFQTDLFRELPEGQLPLTSQQDIQAALEVLNRLSTKRKSSHLEAFAQRFVARYDTQEVPLLEALDTEIGIGYLANQGTPLLPLVEDIAVPAPEENKPIEWSPIQEWLFRQLQIATEQKKYAIDLKNSDIAQLPQAHWDDLPPSFSVMFRWIEDENQQKRVLIESAGGASAAYLLGRFAHGHLHIADTVSSITDAEQAQNPQVVFAEIIHLPESRTGNILLHPAFRAYEIPFLGKSSLPLENQISVQDLYISVRQGEITLRSQRLNKIVVPRLSNAHNYSHNSLPVYQFLCDLQHQGKRTRFGFDWGNLAEKFLFLPRVTYQNTLLHPATWQLQKKQIDAILTDQPLLDVPQFQNRLLTLAEGDNELILDWSNPLSVSAFKDAIKNRTQIQLKEFLYEHTQPTFQDPISQNGFVNQCIALLIRQTSAYTSSISKRPTLVPIRHFSIGSEWLYFKLYGGVKVADKILVAFVKPLCEELQRSHLIDKWFFIRYSDPDHHLRIRFHLRNSAQIGEVIRLFYHFLQPALDAKYLWKIQADTYERELERYGFEVIELTETLFYHDSEAILAFLDQTEGDLREEVRWLYGIRAIDALLDSFDFDFQRKFDLLNSLRDSFAREFNMDLSLKQQLDQKYRLHRSTIQDILSDKPTNLSPFLLEILTTKSANIAPIVDEIVHLSSPSPVKHWLGSYIHMLLNRLIPAHQRLHELVVYDFLSRQYKSNLHLEAAL
jgi:lantibiotic biosynthesis protein